MRVFQSRRVNLRRMLLGSALALACSACVSIYRDHGYVPNEEDLATIKIGDTREAVTEAVGAAGGTAVAASVVATRVALGATVEAREAMMEVMTEVMLDL